MHEQWKPQADRLIGCDDKIDALMKAHALGTFPRTGSALAGYRRRAQRARVIRRMHEQRELFPTGVPSGASLPIDD